MIKTKTINPLSLERFTFHEDTKTLVAEASDFGPMRDGAWWMQRLYDDACDVGIAIRSHETDRVQVFHLEREETRDGDLLAWHFKPMDKTCPVRGVTIFND